MRGRERKNSRCENTEGKRVGSGACSRSLRVLFVVELPLRSI